MSLTAGVVDSMKQVGKPPLTEKKHDTRSSDSKLLLHVNMNMQACN